VSFLGNHKRLFLGGAVIVLIAVVAFLYWRSGPDPQVEHVRALGKQLADNELSASQRQEVRKQFREEVRQLAPEQRRDLFKDRREAFQKRIADYFKKPRQEQIAQLDQDIKRMDEFLRQRQQDPTAQANNLGTWRGGNSEDRDLRRRERLDQSTPQERAQRAEYFRQLNERRQQLGMGAVGRC
jgi:hypothetical protein